MQPDFHRDRPAGQPGRPKALDDPAGHAVDHRSQLRNVGNVTLEGVLDAHRFRLPLRCHFAVVEPVSKQPQTATLTVTQGTDRVGFAELG